MSRRPSDIDARLAAWLEEGPTSGPEEVLSRTFARARSTRQDRVRLRRLTHPTRSQTMNSMLKVAAVVAIITVGGFAASRVGLPPGPGTGAPGVEALRLAPLYGVAANGPVAFSLAGDIYAAQPDGSGTQVLIGGPTYDVEPEFSRDGTKLLFARLVQTEPNEEIELIVAQADGASPRTLFGPVPGEELNGWALSPDGRLLAVASADQLSVVDVSTGARTAIDLPVDVEMLDWLPPGDEIVLLGAQAQSPGPRGFHAVRPDGSSFRTIAELGNLAVWELQFSVSDDGRYIAYSTYASSGGQLHLVDVATGTDSGQSAPFYEWNLASSFSPDSSRVVFTRYNNRVSSRIDAQVFIAPVDDLASVVAVGPMQAARHGGGGIHPYFSPDGTQLFITSFDLLGSSDGDAWLVDLATGTYESISRGTLDGFSWQRLAP
jgi:WD40 repeat protein